MDANQGDRAVDGSAAVIGSDGGRARPKKRRRVSIIGVFGELLITAGVLVFLFLGWQLWLNDIIVGHQQDKAAVAVAHQFGGGTVHAAPAAGPTDFGQPVVGIAPVNRVRIAVIYIPRFGADWSRLVSQGVGQDVLNTTGIGHYPGTAMPGQVGNFATAAHRTTRGASFRGLNDLQVGDKIYVQTKDGYYTYIFRGLEYVKPSGVGVVDPVPQFAGIAATDRVMTMTTCTPIFTSTERLIAYASMDSWQPTSAGAPQAIATTIATVG